MALTCSALSDKLFKVTYLQHINPSPSLFQATSPFAETACFSEITLQYFTRNGNFNIC